MTEPTAIPGGIEAMIVRPVLDPHGGRTPLVHVAWRLGGSAATAAVQLYVDDELVLVQPDPRVGEAWLSLDPLDNQRIDLQAVEAIDPDDAWIACPASEERPVDRVDVRLLRDKALPIDTRVSFAVDAEPIASSALWGPDDVRGGFGSLFGLGAFGIDAASTVGLGLGPLGVDVLDVDHAPLRFRWSPADLRVGKVTVTAAFSDAFGRPVANNSSLEIDTDRLPAPPRKLRLEPAGNLAWTV